MSLLTLTMLVVLSTFSLEATMTPELGVSEALLGSKDTRFDTKLQLQTTGEAGLSLAVGSMQAGGFVGLHYALPSSISGGYVYRGFRGWHFGGRLGYRFASIRGPRGLEIRPGVRLAGSARYSRFQFTELIFFYPHAGVTMMAEVGRPSSPIGTRFLIPIDVYFRRDLTYSVSIGLGVEVVWDMVRSIEGWVQP